MTALTADQDDPTARDNAMLEARGWIANVAWAMPTFWKNPRNGQYYARVQALAIEHQRDARMAVQS